MKRLRRFIYLHEASINSSLAAWRTAIPEYLEWYNGRRPHLALDMKSPIDML